MSRSFALSAVMAVFVSSSAADDKKELPARRTPEVVAVERTRAAVVNLHVERNAPLQPQILPEVRPGSGIEGSGRVNGMGAGVVIDPRGYVVTANHTVEDTTSLRIQLEDGSKHEAIVIARSPQTDLAIVKIKAPKPLATMPIGTATDLMVAERIIAIGNPYGYGHSVSVGVVSAMGRDIALNKDFQYKSLIQVDAAVNPGNSGGPLLNIRGELVGIIVAMRAQAKNIGFAVPVDTMTREVSTMLAAARHMVHDDGLSYRDDFKTVVKEAQRTVIVDKTAPDSAADKAGFQPGDILVRVGVQDIACCFDVDRALLERKPGESVPVIVRRKDQEKKLHLVLKEPKSKKDASSAAVWEKLGLKLAPVKGEVVQQANKLLNGGLEVIEVDAEKPAARAGFKKGDVLIGLHDWETVSLTNVAYVLAHPNLANFDPLRFFIVRGGQVRQGSMPIESLLVPAPKRTS